MNDKNLYIKIHREEIVSEDVYFKRLGYFYDINSNVGIHKFYIEYDLKVGYIYDFTYEDVNDSDTYEYLILKKEENNIYYIAEYYNDKFYQYNEKNLADCWIKCDIKKELEINIDKWKSTKIINSSLSDTRSKPEELRVKVNGRYLVATSYNGNINIVLENEDGTILDTITAKCKELGGSQIIDILAYDVVNGNTFARSIRK